MHRQIRLRNSKLFVNLMKGDFNRQLFSSTDVETKDVAQGLIKLASVREDNIPGLMKDYGLKVTSSDKRGWTPLLYAAQAGNLRLIERLLDMGANPMSRCHYKHTAADIAKFWQKKECFDLLKSVEGGNKQEDLFFCGQFLDRVSHVREDETEIQLMMQQKDTQYILMHNLSPVIKQITSKRKNTLCQISFENLKNLVGPTGQFLQNNQTVFLGLDKQPKQNSHTLSAENFTDGIPIFCLDISSLDKEELNKIDSDLEVLSHPLGLISLSPKDAALSAQAKSLLHWHTMNQFCSCCGKKTKCISGGWKRVCENTSCKTHKGIHNVSHPRVDPSMITLVVNESNDQCLLARGHHFPSNMYSCLAGFVEPGESIVSACHREVKEEVGVSLQDVEFHGTQPWPSPSTLMIGCIAKATQADLKIDKEELDDARWFTRVETVDMITLRHKERLFVPPSQAIAHHLVKSWLLKTAF